MCLNAALRSSTERLLPSSIGFGATCGLSAPPETAKVGEGGTDKALPLLCHAPEARTPDETSVLFPPELRGFRTRQGNGMKVNLLVYYDWEWDLVGLREGNIRSHDVSRLDLIVRWGGGRRLSGFLPVQSVYAYFYVVDEYWPDLKPEHFDQALRWFSKQEQTLGG